LVELRIVTDGNQAKKIKYSSDGKKQCGEYKNVTVSHKLMLHQNCGCMKTVQTTEQA